MAAQAGRQKATGPVILGYGSSLRTDDGVGQEVVRLLLLGCDGSGAAPELVGARMICGQQLLPEMAAEVASASMAVFVDAARGPRPPGWVTVRWLQPGCGGPAAGGPGCWQDLSPEGLLVLAGTAFGSVPPAALVSVSIDDVAAGDKLSLVARAAAPLAAVAVRLVLRGAAGA